MEMELDTKFQDNQATFQNYNNVAIEYSENFSFSKLDPQIGDIFKVYIDVKYISHDYLPIRRRSLYGSTFYTGSSDLAAIAIHTGCLFLKPKIKQDPARRFCIVQNVVEAMSVPEQDYSEVAKIFEYPLDLTINGIILHIYVDSSPGYFPSVLRNGLESQESQIPQNYCIRVIHSTLITMYDEKPALVEPRKYVRQKSIIPKNIFSSSGEIQFMFEPKVFVQIFSRINLNRGMFKVFKLYFDVNRSRYEIINTEKTKFNVILDTLNDDEIHQTIVENVDISDFYVKRNTISAANHIFSPVQTIFLVQCTRKHTSRSHSAFEPD